MKIVGFVAMVASSMAVMASKDNESNLVLLQRRAQAKIAAMTTDNFTEVAPEAEPPQWEPGNCRDAVDSPLGCPRMINAGFGCLQQIGADKQEQCGNGCADMGARAAQYDKGNGYCHCYYASPEARACPSGWSTNNPSPTLQSDPVTYVATGTCAPTVVCAASVGAPPTPAPADCILPDSINDGTKCGDPGNPDRLMDLRKGDATLQMCSTKCANDPECVAFSGIWGQWCIGCKVPLSAGHTGAVAYKDACKAATTSATTPDDVEGIVKPYGSCNADSRSPTTAGMTCLKSADKIDLKCSSGKCVGGAGKNAKCRSNKFTGKTHKGEFICKNGLRCAGYIDGKQWGKCVN